MKRISLAAMLLAIGLNYTPCFAQTANQFLQFDNNGVVSARWIGEAPANITVYPFVPSTGADGRMDDDLRNYKLVGATVVYAPEVVPVQPNMAAFKDAIWADNAIPASAKLQLTIFFPVLESYLQQPVKIQTAWAALYTGYSPEAAGPMGWVTAEIKAAVEADAAAAHIPLVP